MKMHSNVYRPEVHTQHSPVIVQCLISAWLRQEEISLSALCYCNQNCSRGHPLAHKNSYTYAHIHIKIYIYIHKDRKQPHPHISIQSNTHNACKVQYTSKSIHTHTQIFMMYSLPPSTWIKIWYCVCVYVYLCVSPNQRSPINLSVSQWVYSNTRCASLFRSPSTILSLP